MLHDDLVLVHQGELPVEDPGPTYAYTIGLTDAGVAELLIVGLDLRMMEELLHNAVPIHMREELQPGGETDGIANVHFRVEAVHDLKPMQQVLNFYGDPHNKAGIVRGLQLLWPDPDGRFPGEPGYDQRFSQSLDKPNPVD